MIRTTRTHRPEADWKTLIQQHVASGQSVPAFCKQRDIGAQSYYFWRKRMATFSEPTATHSMIDISNLMTLGVSPQWHIELDLGGASSSTLNKPDVLSGRPGESLVMY